MPCLWEATDVLLDAVVDEPGQSPAVHAQLEALRDYLRFKSRGVPRLLLMELNAFVRWDGANPYLEIGGADVARVEFYAGLERILAEFTGTAEGARPFTLAIDEDRWRLGAYYLTDWILRSEGASFTVAELIDAESDSALDPLFSLSERKVSDLLEHLVLHGVVEQLRGRAADQTYYGDVSSAQDAVYRLSRDIGIKLHAFARVNERERADLAPVEAAGQPWADSEVSGTAANGRYELVEELDRAGQGRVYRARDRQEHREVAVKLYDGSALHDDDLMRARFARKAAIARAVSHPNIVRTYETFTDDDGRLGIAMDFVAGTSLEQLLGQAELTPAEAVRIALPLADALEHLHGHGVARLDLKPSNVLVDADFRPVILDLGLAKVVRDEASGAVDPVTMTRAFLGTPAYAAPEQIRGDATDIRSDVYSLGLILYEMITGRRARRGDFSVVLAQSARDIALGDLDISPELRAALAHALERDPDERFATPAAFRDALAAAPEAAAVAPRERTPFYERPAPPPVS